MIVNVKCGICRLRTNFLPPGETGLFCRIGQGKFIFCCRYPRRWIRWKTAVLCWFSVCPTRFPPKHFKPRLVIRKAITKPCRRHCQILKRKTAGTNTVVRRCIFACSTKKGWSGWNGAMGCNRLLSQSAARNSNNPAASNTRLSQLDCLAILIFSARNVYAA